jgi:hypothetical protein
MNATNESTIQGAKHMDRSIKEVRSIYKNASCDQVRNIPEVGAAKCDPSSLQIHIVGNNSSSRLGVLDICNPLRHQAFRMRHATPQGLPNSPLVLPSASFARLLAIQAPDSSMHFSRAYRRKGLVEMQALSWANNLKWLEPFPILVGQEEPAAACSF